MRFLEELKSLDFYLLFLVFLIQVFGLVAIFSASYDGGTSLLFKKQLVYVLLSWIVILGVSYERVRNLLDYSLYLYLLVLFLLILVMAFGKEVYGAKRWLGFGVFNLQPSELMKPALILLSAHVLAHVRSWKDREILLLVFAYSTAAVITLKQPDLGTAVSYFVPLVAMLFIRGVSIKFFLVSLASLILALPIIWELLKEYQKRRILAVIDPYSDYLGSGYQIIQSVIAVGSGGITGKGFLQGTQAHLMFLPEKHTDFIFSVISEEFGFLGAGALVVAFLLLTVRIAVYLLNPLSLGERLTVVGFLALLFFQTTVNMLMTLGLFPVVGIPLPFVSFGGSAMITFGFIVGILQSIHREYSRESFSLFSENRRT